MGTPTGIKVAALLMAGFVVYFFGVIIYSAIKDQKSHEAREQAELATLRKTPEEFIQLAKTLGNSSFVPIGIVGTPSEYHELIQKILMLFEEKHQDLEILNWQVEYQHRSYLYSARVHGLWIQHRKRQ